MRKAPAFAIAFAVAAALALGGCAGTLASEDEASVSSEALSSSASARESSTLVVSANGATFHATLAENPAADELAERLAKGPVTVNLHDYGGFEKVGPLPWGLPANDEQVEGQPGDILLYQGNQITVFYGSNNYSYTRLAHIDGATREGLLAALGDGDVEVTLSLG